MPFSFSIKTIKSLPALKGILWSRAARRFIDAQQGKGNTLRDEDTPARLAGVKTLVLDESLVMEGWEAVRMAAAPLVPCDLARFRRQGSWMMLTAGIALGCEGIAPLEAFAAEMGFDRERMGRQYPLMETLPMAENGARETTLHRDAGGVRAFAKGAPEAILSLCDRVLDGRERPMTDEDRKTAQAAAAEMEREGLYTLAFATTWRETPGDYEKDMVFLGVVGLGDLPTEEAPAALNRLRACGIRPVLLTALDLPERALSVGQILPPGRHFMAADDMDALEDDALAEAALSADAFVGLRVAHRRRILRALRQEGTVAVVSQGVDGALLLRLNGGDAPDALITSGKLDAAAALLEECRALTREME